MLAVLSRTGCGRRLYPRLLLIFGAMCGAIACAGATQAQVLSQSIPSQTYFGAMGQYWDGDYRGAVGDFLGEERSGIKSGGARWIDSICYAAMAGDCYYHMGQHQQALVHLTAALQIYASYPDWMLRVTFPALRPANTGEFKPLPWGRSTRNFVLGHFPDTMQITVGNFSTLNGLVGNGGGVATSPMGWSVNVQEIVRATALAMRRRREIMGPACAQDSLTTDLIAAVSRQVSPPNHWSECWVDLLRGIAYTCGGKDIQAKASLERAVLAGGQYDHPLTGMAFLELGRLALIQGDYNAATNYFNEATYSAAIYGDPMVVEEAFRLTALTHIVSNRPAAIIAPLTMAATWARAKDLRQMNVSTQILAAECSCYAGQPQAAVPILASAASSTARRTMFAGKIGARWNIVSALAAYQLGKIPDGDRLTALALAFQKNGSLRLFHIALVDTMYTAGDKITSHTAYDLYNEVLRDPTPADWAFDPLESLSIHSTPHLGSYANWFDVAAGRKDHERMLEISELARRHRFLTTLDLGGRLHNLRWLLEGPEDQLDAQTKLQRQGLLTQYPDYDKLHQEAARLRSELKQAPLVPEDPAAVHEQSNKLAKLADVSAAQEAVLRQIAVRREGAPLVFPPFRTYKQIKAGLAPGQALVSFFSTPQQAYALLIAHDDKDKNYHSWKAPRSELTVKAVARLLQGIGNVEANHDVTLKDLQADAWRETARQIFDALTKDSRIDFKKYNQLIIVPDGPLWYLPFEMLPIHDGEATVPLIEKMSVRYAPLASLGAGDARPRRTGGPTAVVVGKLMPGGDATSAEAAAEAISTVLPGSVVLRPPLPHATGSFTALADGLIVLNDIHVSDDDPYGWAPLPADQKNLVPLSEWFTLPFGGPESIILPGFHTSAERALKKQNTEPGQELFLATCGLMANGARTILLSRWRTGGETSVDLVREFAQELPRTTAAEAWQRSVLLERENTLNPPAEPRLHLTPREEPPKADHPFFWAGYLLVDTGAPPRDVEGRDRPAANEADAAANPVGRPAAFGDQPMGPGVANPPAGLNGPGGLNRGGGLGPASSDPSANGAAPTNGLAPPAGNAAPGGGGFAPPAGGNAPAGNNGGAAVPGAFERARVIPGLDEAQPPAGAPLDPKQKKPARKPANNKKAAAGEDDGSGFSDPAAEKGKAATKRTRGKTPAKSSAGKSDKSEPQPLPPFNP